MRPIVNMPDKDRATDIGKMRKNLVKIAHVVPQISSRTDRQTNRQTDKQTDILIAILHNRSRGRSNESNTIFSSWTQIITDTYLDLWGRDWLGETKERQSEVDEAVLEHLQIRVTLDQLHRPPPQPFYGHFSGTTRVSRCQNRTSGLYDAREHQQRQTQPAIRLGATASGLTRLVSPDGAGSR